MNSMLETVTKGSILIWGRPTRPRAGSARALRRAAVRDLKNRTRNTTARAVLKVRCQNSVVFKRTLCPRLFWTTAECTLPTCAEMTFILAQLEQTPARQGRLHAGEYRCPICYPDTCNCPRQTLLCIMVCRMAHPLMRVFLAQRWTFIANQPDRCAHCTWLVADNPY
jgi:hypothetical protein